MLGRSLFVVASAAAAVLAATPGAGANPASPGPATSPTPSATATASTPPPTRPTPSVKPSPRSAPDLAAIGTTVRAVGVDQVKIRVGVKNVSSAPVVMPPDSATDHPVIAYIRLPGNTFGVRAPERCAGWGPSEEGWEWADPGLASHMYACLGVTVQPGRTDWIDITLKVYPDRKATRGFVLVGTPDAVSANNEAEITVLTNAPPPARGGGTGGSGLPVTGVPLIPLATGGAVLILLGALVLASARRRRTVADPRTSSAPPTR